MKILKKEFNWARPLKPLVLSQVTGIALHHMEHPTAGMDEVHSWHLARGWKGFAYNYCVDFHGIVWECRGLNAGGGLYDPLNDSVISIGFLGDYDKANLPDVMFNSGVEIIRYLRELIPTITLIAGHRYWDPKTCPGTKFPLERMIQMADTMQKIKDYDNISDWAKDAVLDVVEKGIMVGDDKGFFNPTKQITRQEVAVIVSRLTNKEG